MKDKNLDRIGVHKGDITLMEVDAIVNAANSSLVGGGGVDGAIHRAAGPGLLEECRGLGECPAGEARITSGHNLKARYVIHTVGPIYSNSAQDPVLLAGCYENSFRLALEKEIQTIAFPAISCGVYGYPIGDACKIALETTRDFLEKNEALEQVIFVLFSDPYLKVYEKELHELYAKQS
ncbi:O-acetyl-ADP-ribose deacetylase [Desulfospira joergensenii]|uniref:O-acetyl-ADP-ribose deacetylase n=1 Tax=Desulfospira joergensenii TaxID=53329 RepID=UPI0003B5865B|nr:O-acetyl-ADP-ribose deacetylase [Desulfospira joergensenii]